MTVMAMMTVVFDLVAEIHFDLVIAMIAMISVIWRLLVDVILAFAIPVVLPEAMAVFLDFLTVNWIFAISFMAVAFEIKCNPHCLSLVVLNSILIWVFNDIFMS